MVTKTISITEEAYNVLKSWKTSGDSFSDVIIRKGKHSNIMKYAGILSKKEGDELMKAYQEGRRHSRTRRVVYDS